MFPNSIRPRKTKGDLDRRDVIIAYLRDFGRALKLEREEKAVIVYTDESYIHQIKHMLRTDRNVLGGRQKLGSTLVPERTDDAYGDRTPACWLVRCAGRKRWCWGGEETHQVSSPLCRSNQ